MTEKEFLEYVDGFGKDAGEFTDDEIYQIACTYKNEIPTSQKRWERLIEILGVVDKEGNPKKAETFRIWLKGRQYADGTITKNVQMLSGQTIDGLTFQEFEDKTEEIKRNLYIEKTKTRDVYNAYRRTLRDEARIESIKETISGVVDELSSLPEVEFEGLVSEHKKEAVLLFSDLHIGTVVDSFYNKYNNEIARKRVAKLVDDTIKYCRDNNVQRLNVLNLGDMVSGIIHVSGRIENSDDVISQVMLASEILAESLNKLQQAAPEIIYRSCTDNHGRVVADYHQHIEKENFSRLIDFYLEARLVGTKVVFDNKNLDDDIGMFELLNGKKMLFVHGHRDRDFGRTLMGIGNVMNTKIDYLCLGHYHSTNVKSIQGATVFTNSSIMGSDSYASSVRLYGPASQTLLVFDDNNVINVNVNLDIY